MKRTKRWLAGLLCAVLLAGLLPTAALAAEAGWAQPAVTALNQIYGGNTFVASDEAMTEGDAYTFASQMGYTGSDLSSGSATGLTRAKACTVLANIFGLPVTGSAIQYLYNQNIINGRGSGDLAEDEAITKAEFAVITYRVLNSVGGGDGSKIEGVKSGTKEHTAWMTLTVRGCLGYQDGETQKTDSPIEIMDESTLNRWKDKLGNSANSITMDSLGQNLTKLTAAVAIVKHCNITQVFTDVAPDDWYYDGVMYLFDHGIVSGYGDAGRIGTFGPNDGLQKVQLAAIISRISPDFQPPTGKYSWDAEVAAAKKYVVSKGYMTDSNWESPTTREEAIVAIVKSQGVNVSNVNTNILGRFSGGTTGSPENAQYIAYAVSIGLVNGTAQGGLSLNTETTRGMFGVLLYRTLIGVDKTKMKDYADNVSYATGAAQTQTFALFAAPAAQSQQTLTLREDWRLTSDLNLAVPEGATLTINGNGHHIYEMGGKLTNSGNGTAVFANGTILYPAANDAAGVTSSDGTWDTNESNALMNVRQGTPSTDPDPGTETGGVDIEYTRFATPTAHLASGYFTIKDVDGVSQPQIVRNHKYLVQLVHSGVASIFVVDAQSDNTLKFLCNSEIGDSLGVWDLTVAGISSFDNIKSANATSLQSNCVVWQSANDGKALDAGFFKTEGQQ